jgi:hypothetical protein
VLESYAAVWTANGDFPKKIKKRNDNIPKYTIQKSYKAPAVFALRSSPTLRVPRFSFVRPLFAAHLFCSFTLFTARAG